VGAIGDIIMPLVFALEDAISDLLCDQVAGQPISLPPQQLALLERLEAAEAAYCTARGRVADGGRTMQQRVQLLQRHFVQPVTVVAAVLLEFWGEKELVAAARLELAQGATARSCAFLGCSNLGLAGGPAGGEGQGSLKCAGCRSAWYCGEACSHADWRAGHKRVCKALAALRLQARSV
jgi:hypothetical protein